MKRLPFCLSFALLLPCLCPPPAAFAAPADSAAVPAAKNPGVSAFGPRPALPPQEPSVGPRPVRREPGTAPVAQPPGPAATAAPGIAPKALLKLSFSQTLALQVGLDRLAFSPGCIDGKSGGQTTLAIQAWQISNGQAPTGSLTPEDLAKLGNPDDALALYTVTEEDDAAICSTPKSWKEKSEMTRLGYYSLIELVAEQFHCKEDLLRRLNPELDWKTAAAGTEVTVPDTLAGEVRPGKAARLQVNLQEKYIRAYDAKERLIAHFPCSIAKAQEKRPSGDGKVITAAKDPSYTYDPALFADEPESKLYNGKKMIIPPGPNNPVGTAWVSLNLPGYGMHGTPKPEDIGKTGSHGCFRLANWNAEKLLRMVDAGIPVKFEP